MKSDDAALLENGYVVQALQSAVIHGEQKIDAIPDLVKMVIRKEMWKCRVTPQTGGTVEYRNFAEFVADDPPEGIGASMETLKRICLGDVEAVDLIDQALKGKQGSRTDLVYNIHEVIRPSGTSRDASLRRLRKDRPDLHARVVAGEVSAHRAMVDAGFRPKTATIPLEPEPAARALLRHFGPEGLAEVIREVGRIWENNHEGRGLLQPLGNIAGVDNP